ncbi:DUF6249 domain-containing protein [Stenotrophomonas sp.]|uniref:DUF6249 domain-containing protein n=1 Tax=Stenotrophomonas sp. TaxID=69392 RepID=UPI002FCB438D
MDSNFIPVIGVICIVVMLITFSIINSRNQAEVQRTLRAALERGVALDPALVAQMNTSRPSPNNDLRRGLVIIAIGLAAALAGVITGAMMEFSTVAVFPLFMGLAFLLMWKIDQRRPI